MKRILLLTLLTLTATLGAGTGTAQADAPAPDGTTCVVTDPIYVANTQVFPSATYCIPV